MINPLIYDVVSNFYHHQQKLALLLNKSSATRPALNIAL
jgi:hypothetical protein